MLYYSMIATTLWVMHYCRSEVFVHDQVVCWWGFKEYLRSKHFNFRPIINKCLHLYTWILRLQGSKSREDSKGRIVILACFAIQTATFLPNENPICHLEKEIPGCKNLLLKSRSHEALGPCCDLCKTWYNRKYISYERTISLSGCEQQWK